VNDQGEPRSLCTGAFPAEPASIPASRHALAEFLAGRVADDPRSVAALLVTELASNALRHAATPFTIRADLTPCHLRVEVADGTGDEPVELAPAPGEIGGRGILLVNRLADHWGSERTPDGKNVWFELYLNGWHD
jgi:anti-sigma regulatory factor (Ser/Thr protein kinase)